MNIAIKDLRRAIVLAKRLEHLADITKEEKFVFNNTLFFIELSNILDAIDRGECIKVVTK